MKKHKKEEQVTQKEDTLNQQNPEEFEETISPNLRMKQQPFEKKSNSSKENKSSK